MKKTTILTALIMLLAVFTAQSQTAVQPAGDGTSGNPYQIATLDNLYWLSQADTAWDKNYIQTANIDATSTNTWDSGAGFSPIGTGYSTSFSGVYDGQGYIIENLFINRPSENNIALFGYLRGDALISNIGVISVDITGNNTTASLIGGTYGNNIIVSNSYATGEVIGVNSTAGFAGNIYGITILNSFTNCNVTSTGNYVAGFVGYNAVDTIQNCYATGNVTGNDKVAGFVATNSTADITNCYSTGNVTGNTNVGGFSINNTGTISNSFWDTETSGQATSDGGTGKTTAEMQTLATFTDATWDFVGETTNGTDDYWDMNACLSDYPTLSWQVFETPIGSGTTVDPYQIATLEDLRWLSENDCVWDKNFIQTEDINAGETTTWNAGAGFSPIGYSTTGFSSILFTGVYNGQGHIIDSLFINRSGSYFGLFGLSEGAYFDSIGITNVNIIGYNNETGALCGHNRLSSSINNCYSSGNISGHSAIGGLVGTIESSSSVNNSYSLVNVSGDDQVGGLTATNWGGIVDNCYSTGVVNGSTNTGGLIGKDGVGGTTNNSFWDTETSGQTTSIGGTGKTTAEMQTLTTYTNSTWDFVGATTNGTDDNWDMSICLNGGYPYLSWQNLSFTTPAGSGTTADPYQIATLDDLRWLSENSCVWDKYFIQTADINADETDTWNISGTDTLGFSPIGDDIINFTGSYNGQGYITDNLFINRPTQNSIGLFGYANSSIINNLGMTNINITGRAWVGGIIGRGEVTTLNELFSNGFVLGTSADVGGVIGYSNQNSSINNCYSFCTVTGTGSSDGNIGGVVGLFRNSSTMIYSYSIGAITGIANGGLVGALQNASTITNSFYNTDSTATSAGGTGLTTLEMQQLCVYADSTWDFMIETVNGTNDIWGLNANENGGYPFLSWQGYTHTEECCGYVDLTNPTITCVANQTVTADATHNYTVSGTEFDPADNNDNCGVASIENDFNNSSTLDGETLPEGTTTITWTVTDDTGNINTCSFDVQVDNFVGIENTVSENGISIYPNPAHNMLTISNEQLIINNIEIMDVTGKVVKQLTIEQSNNLTIEIEDLKQGIYFIKLTTNNSTEILSFVKK